MVSEVSDLIEDELSKENWCTCKPYTLVFIAILNDCIDKDFHIICLLKLNIIQVLYQIHYSQSLNLLNVLCSIA